MKGVLTQVELNITKYNEIRHCKPFWCNGDIVSCYMSRQEKNHIAQTSTAERQRKQRKKNLEQTINRWIAQKQMSLSELNNIISHYKNSKQKGK